MARFLAICSQPEMNESKFKEALGGFKKWRPDRWTFVTKAYACADGKIVAECEAREKAHFEQWLMGTGWKVEGIHDVTHIHEAGQIWKM
ncbi:MAG: hypothetical protein Q8P22_11375 [Chloroflexota bacterium]|nr:hypothetical protein [Chloroflexota bacterium]